MIVFNEEKRRRKKTFRQYYEELSPRVAKSVHQELHEEGWRLYPAKTGTAIQISPEDDNDLDTPEIWISGLGPLFFNYWLMADHDAGFSSIILDLDRKPIIMRVVRIGRIVHDHYFLHREGQPLTITERMWSKIPLAQVEDIEVTPETRL